MATWPQLWIAAGTLASCAAASTSTSSLSEEAHASQGVVLLQRPDIQHSHVEFADLSPHEGPGHDAVLPRPLVSALEFHPNGNASVFDPVTPFGFVPMNTFLIGAEWSRWSSHHRHKKQGPEGVHAFLSSVVLFDWCLFAIAIMVFLLLHYFLLGKLSAKGWHFSVLLIWLGVGASYNAVIWFRFGMNAGVSWFAGYLLEYIFLVENIFIFHIVVQAFKTPLKLTTKALHVVVWGQIIFEMIFFMGLAMWLRSFKVLPYILGVWLICCGLLATRGETVLDADIMETPACRAFISCLGDRLSKQYEKESVCLFKDAGGRLKVSLLGLVVIVLLLVDFLLEIDVVLTKIEELHNPYIAFTSSALAAFSIPELFFVSKGLLQRFVMLKYGIAFVLILFGTQMLLSSIYILRPIVACCIIMTVLLGSVGISAVINLYRDPGKAEQAEEAAEANGGFPKN
mmetsp:Transcript_100167/g.188725  ORF Transcript_100167/g.188725 Transcript_100167/m.188725 type:complete len:455 (-) Transcript_100167:116-1480(-)